MKEKLIHGFTFSLVGGIQMRNIENVEDKKICEIVNKITDGYFLSTVEELDRLYEEDTKDGNILFLDTLIGLEPTLKKEIQKGHISENEMDRFIEFYGSIINDKSI